MAQRPLGYFDISTGRRSCSRLLRLARSAAPATGGPASQSEPTSQVSGPQPRRSAAHASTSITSPHAAVASRASQAAHSRNFGAVLRPEGPQPAPCVGFDPPPLGLTVTSAHPPRRFRALLLGPL